jgi:hypothetical protein
MNHFSVPDAEASETALLWISAAFSDVQVEQGHRVTLLSPRRTKGELAMIWKAARSNEAGITRFTQHRQAVMDLLLR